MTNYHGICFGPYQNNQNPNNQTPIPSSQIDMLVQLAAPYFDWFLTYGTLDGLDYTGIAAHNAGRKCAAGAYINQQWMEPSNEQVDKLIQMANAGQCDQAIVGNEPLLNNGINMPVATLKSFIQRARNGITSNVPITTALISGNWIRYAADIVPLVDVCNIHIYPWWEGIKDVTGALTLLNTEYQATVAAIHKVSPGKKCYLGETGWPSQGDPAATVANQVLYFKGVQNWAKSEGIDVFWFEMLNEKWKDEGSVGAYWGIWGEANPGTTPPLVWPNMP